MGRTKNIKYFFQSKAPIRTFCSSSYGCFIITRYKRIACFRLSEEILFCRIDLDLVYCLNYHIAEYLSTHRVTKVLQNNLFQNFFNYHKCSIPHKSYSVNDKKKKVTRNSCDLFGHKKTNHYVIGFNCKLTNILKALFIGCSCILHVLIVFIL